MNKKRHRTLRPFISFSVCLLWSATSAISGEGFLLTLDGKTDVTIVVPEKASERTLEAASDLATYLQRITGASFPTQSTTAARTIFLATNEEVEDLPFPDTFENHPFSRDAYQLFTSPDTFYIIGDTDYGIQNGVWDFLHSLGYRQYFPGENWEIVPVRKDVTVTMDRHVKPDFVTRNLGYNWGAVDRKGLNDWAKKNRMQSAFKLNNGHSHFRIRQWAKATFKEHPEFTALVNGKRKSNKFCISNPELRKLCVRYALDYFEKNPDADSISMEPDDGGGECQCEPCAAMGSPSDRILLLANEVARAVNEASLGEKYVGILAYNFHCAPPEKVKADPHVIVSCTRGYSRGGWSFYKICEGWRATGAIMGAYIYYNVVVRDWCLPGINRPYDVAHNIRRYHQEFGIRFASFESGESWGPYGVPYYVTSRVLWDSNIGSPYSWDDPRTDNSQVQAIVDEFIENCFGPAAEPMRVFYTTMIIDRHRYNSVMPTYYKSLAEARKMATGHPEVIARIDDLIKYMHYVTLHYQGKKQKQDLLKWVYRIRNTKMVHSVGIFSRKHKVTYGFKGREGPLYDQTPISEKELLQILHDDTALHMEKDKSAVYPVEKLFSTDLVPVRGHLAGDTEYAKGVLPKNGPHGGHMKVFVYLKGSPAVLHFKANVAKAETRADLKFTLHQGGPAGEVVAEHLCPKGSTEEGEVMDIAIKAPAPGLYCLAATMGNGLVRLEFPPGQSYSLAIPPYIGEVIYHQHLMYHGKWDLYFYVPKGTEVVSIRGSKIWSFTSPIRGKLLDGDGNELADFKTVSQGGNINVEVPEGQDGRFWMFKDSTGIRHLFNVPPYISDTPENLLLPQEIIDKDFSKESGKHL